jgi:hypothetical protein
MENPTMNEGNETYQEQDKMYFAAKNSKNLATDCLTKAESFYNTLSANSYLDKIAKMWYFYHGEYADSYSGGSHQIGFTGEHGELTSLPVNHFRNIAQHMLVMITANRPTMEARAVNTDYKSLAQTYLANGILDYYMREKKLEDAIRRVTEMAIVLGAGFIRLEWNATAGELYDFDPETGEGAAEGELEWTTHSPFDVVFDGTKDSWSNEWLLVRTSKNKYNLMAKYPELADKINALPPKSELSKYKNYVFSNDSTDDIEVFEFFHERTEAMPEGRYCLFLNGDIVLLDMPLPYRQIPIFRISAGEFIGTPYGYTPMFDVFPLQEGVNSLYSTIMTNQSAFGVQNLFVKRGSDLNINSLEGALNILEGNEMPVPLNLTQTPKEIFDFLNILVQSMETISGVNSVARGDPQSSLKSGTALALVQSMALQFISGLQNNYVKLIEEVGGAVINILKDYAKTPKTVALVGKNNRTYLKEFTSEDINSISRVFVSVGNALARTTAGRVQMAEQLLQMDKITARQYIQVIETGSLESVVESDMQEYLLIKQENEYLMEARPVLADMWDMHAEHIMEHRSVMADPDLRQDPNLRKAVQDHIQQHINFLRTVDPDLLMIMKQQPLQNPMAPQMAPPMSGPPGSPQSGGNQMMQPPGGIPQPGDMLNGQGVAGGQIIPQPANPPPPFEHLPTSASDMAPQ